MKPTVHIEFISDFICPWCYLGKARLERVKAAIADDIQLEIEVKPYVLYPNLPKGGVPKSYFAKKTKPGMGRSLRMEAEKENVQLNYKNIEYIPYSLEAHRLVWLVEDNAIKYALAMRLFYGYFEEGKNIEAVDYLVEQATLAGVETAVLEQFKNTNAGEAECQAYIKATRAAFINVVPTLKLDRKFLVTGLQSADVLENYIRRAARIQAK